MTDRIIIPILLMFAVGVPMLTAFLYAFVAITYLQ